MFNFLSKAQTCLYPAHLWMLVEEALKNDESIFFGKEKEKEKKKGGSCPVFILKAKYRAKKMHEV